MVEVDHVKEAFTSNRMDMTRFILVMFFIIEQRWRYVIEKELEPDNLTTKQWLLLIVIGAGFQDPPSIQEAAEALSTTHQNVKQIASGLERRGFMTLRRDPKNKRIIRLTVTEKCHDLFRAREPDHIQSINSIFENLTDEEVKVLFSIIAKMEHRADELYQSARAARLGQGKTAESGDGLENC